ncbi:MAG TPA: response regulator transcription factor, partial [Cytophagaceae bacterium]
MEKIKIVLADDHKLMREGITALLKKIPEFSIVGEAEDGEELVKLLDTKETDVVLVDISMPKLTGIEIIKKYKNVKPNLKFIVLTMHEDVDYILKSVQNGAVGYLLKNAEFEEVEKAIKNAAEGKKYFPSNVSEIMVENLSSGDKSENLELTPRELEVLREVANGLSNKLIADKFQISSRTVESHRVNIMKKLEVHNTAE